MRAWKPLSQAESLFGLVLPGVQIYCFIRLTPGARASWTLPEQRGLIWLCSLCAILRRSIRESSSQGPMCNSMRHFGQTKSASIISPAPPSPRDPKKYYPGSKPLAGLQLLSTRDTFGNYGRR